MLNKGGDEGGDVGGGVDVEDGVLMVGSHIEFDSGN